MFDFLTCFFHPHPKQVASRVVTHGLRDTFAGQKMETIHKSKAVLVFVGGQSRVKNSNA